jgi:hypothetical protein
MSTFDDRLSSFDPAGPVLPSQEFTTAMPGGLPLDEEYALTGSSLRTFFLQLAVFGVAVTFFALVL